jgi:hypothetical protein
MATDEVIMIFKIRRFNAQVEIPDKLVSENGVTVETIEQYLYDSLASLAAHLEKQNEPIQPRKKTTRRRKKGD